MVWVVVQFGLISAGFGGKQALFLEKMKKIIQEYGLNIQAIEALPQPNEEKLSLKNQDLSKMLPQTSAR